MNDGLRVLVVGVGGQGVIFASKTIGEAVMKASRNVIMSEVHGMAQRGGVVTCHICIGDIHSSIIGDGEADIILSFEPIETYRSLHKANSGTLILTDTSPLIPTSANTGDVEYPDLTGIFDAIRETSEHLITIDATGIAKDLGSHLIANSVMLGALAGTRALPIEAELLKEHILTRVPSKSIDLNSKAFDRGYGAVSD